jgi:hypothetical protein
VQKSAANELKQKVTDAHAGEGSMKVLMAQSQQEVEELQAKYDTDTDELKKQLDALSGDLQEKSEEVTAQTAHVVSYSLFDLFRCYLTWDMCHLLVAIARFVGQEND